MDEAKKEIKVLKGAVKALTEMCFRYRIGKTAMPEWVFDKIGDAKRFYKIETLSEIK